MFCFFSVDSHYGSLHYKPWQANGLISITAYENKVPSGTVLISSCRWCQLEEQKEKHVTLELKKKKEWIITGIISFHMDLLILSETHLLPLGTIQKKDRARAQNDQEISFT